MSSLQTVSPCTPAGCSSPTSLGYGGARSALPLLLPKEPTIQSKVR